MPGRHSFRMGKGVHGQRDMGSFKIHKTFIRYFNVAASIFRFNILIFFRLSIKTRQKSGTRMPKCRNELYFRVPLGTIAVDNWEAN